MIISRIIRSYAERLVPYYSALAEAGREAGLLVFGHDHAGHGESEGERVLVADMAELTGPLVQHCRDKMEQVGQVWLLEFRNFDIDIFGKPLLWQNTINPKKQPSPIDFCL